MDAQLNDRTKQIELAFDEYDDGNKGYLTIDETKRFFHKVLDLNFDCPQDRRTFAKIMRLVQSKTDKIVVKENIIAFFTQPDFGLVSRESGD